MQCLQLSCRPKVRYVPRGHVDDGDAPVVRGVPGQLRQLQQAVQGQEYQALGAHVLERVREKIKPKTLNYKVKYDKRGIIMY